jgi:tetratricopeptide (TPR) repeat protein
MFPKVIMRRPAAILLVVVSVILSTIVAGVMLRRRAERKELESTYLALAKALEAANQTELAVIVKEGCVAARDACGCGVAAARAALDGDRPVETLAFLDRIEPKCLRPHALDGVRSEAFARSGKREQAERLAQATVLSMPDDPYAHMALARLECDADHMTKCRESAQRALELGRGIEAERLVGRTLLAQGSFEPARQHFRRLLDVEPRDREALFTDAICSDRLGQYHDAREGFLHVLQVDPAHVRARIQLVALTANSGALDEARHHLSKLEALLPPNDPQLAAARVWVDHAAAAASPSARAVQP